MKGGSGQVTSVGPKTAELIERGEWPPAPLVAVFKCWRCGSTLKAKMSDCKLDALTYNDDITRYTIMCPVCEQMAVVRSDDFRVDIAERERRAQESGYNSDL